MGHFSFSLRHLHLFATISAHFRRPGRPAVTQGGYKANKSRVKMLLAEKNVRLELKEFPSL